jgi:hypothetical protein
MRGDARGEIGRAPGKPAQPGDKRALASIGRGALDHQRATWHMHGVEW